MAFVILGWAAIIIAAIGALITLTRDWDLWDFTFCFWMIGWCVLCAGGIVVLLVQLFFGA